LGIFFWQQKYPVMNIVFIIALCGISLLIPWKESFYPALNSQQFGQKLLRTDFFETPLTKKLLDHTDYLVIAQAGKPSGYLVGRNKSNGIVFAAQITEIDTQYGLQGIFMLQTPEYFTQIYRY
jgi:hypothetical protein